MTLSVVTFPRVWICLLLAVLAMGSWLAPASADQLLVQPSTVVLRGPEDAIQLLVSVRRDDGALIDATHRATYRWLAEGSSVARVDNGRVEPVADGNAVLKIEVPGVAGSRSQALSDVRAPAGRPLNVSIPVRVVNYDQPLPVHFANDIVPLLTKLGCNSGGCHGKASGQNGFKLSLLGDDPSHDYEALVRHARGRRLFFAAPEESLLIRKATASIAHGGGKRLLLGSRAHRTLLRWITAGAPQGNPAAPRVRSIRIAPGERVLASGASQQLRVTAIFSDGSQRDVTRNAQFVSQQEDLLTVDHRGQVKSLGRTGEATVMVRYQGHVGVSRLTMPHAERISEDAYQHFHPAGFIDQLVLTRWKKLRIAPSPLASDEELVRRVYLDAVGTLPTPEEVRQFVNDQSANRVERLVDRVLEHPAYADYWALYWSDLLRNKRRYGNGYKHGTYMFSAWIRSAFAKNMPYDQFVRAILTAQGNVSDNPAVVWYREVRNEVHMVNNTSQLFLGTRMECANCHNHPYEALTQDDYWSFAGFFARVGKKSGEVANEQAIYVRKDGEKRHPKTGLALQPTALDGQQFAYVRGDDPRQDLVTWMVAPDNPYFAKAIVNRMWGRLMGVGLVSAVDDMRATNPPTNPELLDALARDFVEHKFNLKHLLKRILTSRVYALSSQPIEANQKDRQNYARYYARRLPAHVLLDAISQVTNRPEKFNGFPEGTRAIQLPDESVSSYFLDVFGRSKRESPCECETTSRPNLSQVLQLMNSYDIHGKIAHKENRLSRQLEGAAENDEIVRDMFIRCFARTPNKEEMTAALELIAERDNRKEAFQDLLWALMNTKEFLFNH